MGNEKKTSHQRHRVVIIGGGFGGLYAALKLGTADVDVTVIDRRNFHLFQPLLYQVATGGLSPADIASPLRGVLSRQCNTRVLLAEATDIDLDNRRVILRDGDLPYDSLIVASGAGHNYFGHDDWAHHAPGLKSVEDALEVRRRVFAAFERAEWEPDSDKRRAQLTFAVVGGGPTGVELAGALGEIANQTLKKDFRNIATGDARVLLIEADDRILGTFPESLARNATRSLERLGVSVRSGSFVTGVDDDGIEIRTGDTNERIDARTVLWAAGVKPSFLAQRLTRHHPELLSKAGTVRVQPDLSLKGHPEVFVIGDLAYFDHGVDRPLPGLAAVAMSQGRYAARAIKNRLRGKTVQPYHYINKGLLATIGRAAAVADFGFLRFSGWIAWVIWLFVHLMYLVEYENRLLVFVQWTWNYFTRNRGARLISPEVDRIPGQDSAKAAGQNEAEENDRTAARA